MTAAAEPRPPPRQRQPLSRVGRSSAGTRSPFFGILALAYLMLPIVVVIVFSFNDPAGRFNYTWEGFTTAHWTNPFGPPFLGDAVGTSIQVALLATRLGRPRHAGRAGPRPLPLPRAGRDEPAHLRAADRARDRARRLPPRSSWNLGTALGFWTIVLAHIMFCISFVVVTVRARLVGFDRHVEEAAMDLGANEYVTFFNHTSADRAGILAGALLAFSLSIDDFVITSFNSGTTRRSRSTSGARRSAASAEVNVIGTMIFGVAIVLMLANILFQYRRTERSRMSVPATGLSADELQKAARDHLWLHFTRMSGYSDGECRSSCAATVLPRGHRRQALPRRACRAFAVNIGYGFGEEIEAAAAQLRELPFYELELRAPARDRARGRGRLGGTGRPQPRLLRSGGSEAVESAWKLARASTTPRAASAAGRRSRAGSPTTGRRWARSPSTASPP